MSKVGREIVCRCWDMGGERAVKEEGVGQYSIKGGSSVCVTRKRSFEPPVRSKIPGMGFKIDMMRSCAVAEISLSAGNSYRFSRIRL
jgi:hypothetical protein